MKKEDIYVVTDTAEKAIKASQDGDTKGYIAIGVKVAGSYTTTVEYDYDEFENLPF